jgi:hypothetical protein
MANPWNPSTAYSPFAVVSYNGLDYVRSNYPPSATSGTPPNEEMSVDDYGVSIRTWTLNASFTGQFIFVQESFYFRLDFPDDPDFPGYAGLGYIAKSAYDLSELYEYGVGVTREYDQFKNNAAPTPDNPECPASECGVARQISGVGDVSWGIYTRNTVAEPRKYDVYLTFNHPLYFRRTFNYTYKTSVTTTIKDPPTPPETVVTTIAGAYVPDDRNFAIVSPGLDYYISANSILTITIPEDEDTSEKKVTYNLSSGAVVTSIESND